MFRLLIPSLYREREKERERERERGTEIEGQDRRKEKAKLCHFLSVLDKNNDKNNMVLYRRLVSGVDPSVEMFFALHTNRDTNTNVRISLSQPEGDNLDLMATRCISTRE